MDLAAWRRLLYYLVLAAAHRLPGHRFSDDGVFFFSSRRRHTRFDCDGVQTCALPIWGAGRRAAAARHPCAGARRGGAPHARQPQGGRVLHGGPPLGPRGGLALDPRLRRGRRGGPGDRRRRTERVRGRRGARARPLPQPVTPARGEPLGGRRPRGVGRGDRGARVIPSHPVRATLPPSALPFLPWPTSVRPARSTTSCSLCPTVTHLSRTARDAVRDRLEREGRGHPRDAEPLATSASPLRPRSSRAALPARATRRGPRSPTRTRSEPPLPRVRRPPPQAAPRGSPPACAAGGSSSRPASRRPPW